MVFPMDCEICAFDNIRAADVSKQRRMLLALSRES
jgi:hypothetical protein